ncbi:CFC_collapsed_G0049970.mRNA.1.CDS.1 [Saccharomyces cerevisiae]|nr:hypothetical protein H793_YJM1307O00244 [Saccharomyces cerevisiae YJM1307]CAI7460675.1 CFC_collapsed_G0049970.mRNA.1.CDS.1 [Saccharomyces cerevisiae]
MILALGDFLTNRKTKHARGPGFNSQLAPFIFNYLFPIGRVIEYFYFFQGPFVL